MSRSTFGSMPSRRAASRASGLSGDGAIVLVVELIVSLAAADTGMPLSSPQAKSAIASVTINLRRFANSFNKIVLPLPSIDPGQLMLIAL
jgi:hypothetical protein